MGHYEQDGKWFITGDPCPYDYEGEAATADHAAHANPIEYVARADTPNYPAPWPGLFTPPGKIGRREGVIGDWLRKVLAARVPVHNSEGTPCYVMTFAMRRGKPSSQLVSYREGALFARVDIDCTATCADDRTRHQCGVTLKLMYDEADVEAGVTARVAGSYQPTSGPVDETLRMIAEAWLTDKA